MLGKERHFPKGTVIMIPINALMLDKRVWGENCYEFDHNRENVVEHSMIFHSLGEKTNGRICPGKSFALTLMIDALIECGKTRPRDHSKVD